MVPRLAEMAPRLAEGAEGGREPFALLRPSAAAADPAGAARALPAVALVRGEPIGRA